MIIILADEEKKKELFYIIYFQYLKVKTFGYILI